MEYYNWSVFFEYTSITITTISVLFCLYLLYVNNKRQKSILEGYRINYLRDKFELEQYNSIEHLLSDEEQFKDVNHLLVFQPSPADISLTRVPNTSFFEGMNINLRNIRIKEKNIACLMPFNKKYNLLHSHLKQVCDKNGFNLVRSDDVELPTTDQPKHIIQMILESKVVIAVLDGRSPNVMYEIGIAHSMGKMVILIAKNEKAPFNISHQTLLLYSSLNSLEEQLSNYLNNISRHDNRG